MGLIYLASPYTHDNDRVVEARVKLATKVAGELLKRGHVVFSPITHFHPIAKVCGLPTDWAFWKNIDEVYIKLSDYLYVLMQDGWEESVGVQAEIEIARELGKTIRYINKERGNEYRPIGQLATVDEIIMLEKIKDLVGTQHTGEDPVKAVGRLIAEVAKLRLALIDLGKAVDYSDKDIPW